MLDGMTTGSVRRIGIALLVVAVVAAVATAVAGAVLADVYRPHAPFQDAATLPPEVRRSDDWSGYHRRASVVLVASTVAVLGLVVWLVATRAVVRRKVAVVAASAVALAAAVVTVLTRPLVEWEQLALTPVTVGEGVAGYWFAAFDDDVRFAVVGSTEVSRGEYVPAMLAHLASPVVGALALLVVAAVLARPSDVAPSPAAD